MRHFYFVLAFILHFVNSSFAQSFDLGSWNILNLKYNHSEKWSVFGEAQLWNEGRMSLCPDHRHAKTPANDRV